MIKMQMNARATVSCRQCGSKFTPSSRAGRDTYRSRSGRTRSLTDAQFCSRKCRQSNYRWRRSQLRSTVTQIPKKFGKTPNPLLSRNAACAAH